MRRVLMALLVAVSGLALAAVPAGAAPLSMASGPIMAAATAPSISTEYGAIVSCNRPGKAVWLTFDDGGSPDRVRRILRILRDENVKAMFFPTGVWRNANRDVVRAMRRQGHVVGNHTYDHPDLMSLGNASVRWQITNGVGGNTTPMLLRPPYGSGAFDARVQGVARDLGYQMCFWTVDTLDWSSSTTRADIIRRVRIGQTGVTPPVRANGVVLMHMQGAATTDALRGVIDVVRDKGLRLPRLVNTA